MVSAPQPPAHPLRPKRRVALVAIGVVLVGVVAALLVVGLGGSGKGSYVVATARTGSVTATIEVSGTIEPVTAWGLSFGSAGTVASVDVAPGQAVVTGQPLAQLDTTALEDQLQQAQGNLQAAQDKLAQDSSSPAPALPSVIASDQAAIAGASAAVASAQQALNAASLVAPGNGVVAAVNITPGQTVTNSGGAPAGGGAAAAASSAGPGPSGAIVINGSQGFLVSAQVADTQVSQVHVGQAALVTPAGAVSPLPGQVSSVAPLGTTTQGVVVFPVSVTIPGNPPGLYAGASAQVAIVVARAKGVVVPTSAVHTLGARTFVFVLVHGKARRHAVQLGPSGATRTAVTSGLQAGTQVVIASRHAKVPNPTGAGSGGKHGRGAAGLLGGTGGGLGGGLGGGKHGRG